MGTGYGEQQETSLLLLSGRKGLEWLEIRPAPGPSLTATAKSLESCPTLCDPIDGSLPRRQY